MNGTYILQLAQQYLFMGIVLSACILILFLIAYFVIYRRVMHGKKKLNKRKVLFSVVFIIYFAIVIGATMLSRGSWYGGSLNLHLFSSYKEAWYNWTMSEWRNIILNILLFVPMGFLMPVIFLRENRFWKVYLTGLVISSAIEVLQFASGRGIVEIDDVFNNTIGTMIGYGVFVLCRYVFKKIKKQEAEKLSRCVMYQIPLLGVVAAFSIIFIRYHNQEFGNLSEHYREKQNMKGIAVSNSIELESKEYTMPIYQTVVADEADTKELADYLFEKLGTTVDVSQNDVYEDTIVYKSEGGNYSLWIDFNGMTTWFNDFTQFEADVHTGFDKNEVLEILEKYGVEIPNEVKFEKNDQGQYILTADMLIDGNEMKNGVLSCSITKDKVIEQYQNSIITYQKYDDRNCISQQEAYQNIVEGKFFMPLGKKLSTVCVANFKLAYRMDSKGFFRPVYEIKVKETDEIIVMPALKK